MGTEVFAEKARAVSDLWVGIVERILKNFQKEHNNPYVIWHTRSFIVGSLPSPSKLGASWDLPNGVLTLFVSLDGEYRVTLESPVGKVITRLDLDEDIQKPIFAILLILVGTGVYAAQARVVAKEWAAKIEDSLRKFREEYKTNPFLFGYMNTSHFTVGGIVSPSKLGTHWDLDGGTLTLYVSLDGEYRVTLARPYGNVFARLDLGEDFEKRLFENLLTVSR